MTYKKVQLPLHALLLPLVALTLLFSSAATAARSDIPWANTERTFQDDVLTAILTAPSGFQDSGQIDWSGGSFTATDPYVVTSLIDGGVSTNNADITWGVLSGTGTAAGKFQSGKQAAEQSFQFVTPGTPNTEVVSEGNITVPIGELAPAEDGSDPSNGDGLVSATESEGSIDGYLIVARKTGSLSIQHEAVVAIPLGKSKSSGDNLYLRASFTMDIPNSDQFSQVTTPTSQSPTDYVASSVDAAARNVSVLINDNSVLRLLSGDPTVAKLTSIKKTKKSVRGKAVDSNSKAVPQYEIALACKINAKYREIASKMTDAKGRFKINVKKKYRDKLKNRLCRLEADGVQKRI